MKFASIFTTVAVALPITNGFSLLPHRSAGLFGVAVHPPTMTNSPLCSQLHMAAADYEDDIGTFSKVPESEMDVPTPFVDPDTGSFIECYMDSVATIQGVEYLIGSPCDYCVALCYFDEEGELNPVELDDTELMDEVFPIAETIVEEEFGEELALMRTPQTLTLVGELELGEDDDMDDYELDLDDMDDEEEEVEILLTFEHDGIEFNLVRLLDPVLLVGKVDKNNAQARTLLTPKESEKVMPYLEEMILDYQEERDSMAS